MFLTEPDLLALRLEMEHGRQESEILRDFIQENEHSVQRQKMLEGERYYCAEHDILKKDFRQEFISETELNASNGAEKEVLHHFRNPNRSNYHMVNAFYHLLVDQKVYYLLSREPSVRVDGSLENPDLQQYEHVLSDFMDETFNEMLQEVTIQASNQGFGVIHPYYGEDGQLHYGVIPAGELILVYDSRYEKELLEVIRYYTVMVSVHGKMVPRRRVEWWTKSDVTYYMEQEPDVFVRDRDVDVNPAPHWWEVGSVNGIKKFRRPHAWGRVPFVILKNNRYMKTDLEYVKGLIDAYDLLASEGVNNFADLVDLYWVIAGYGGETASAMARKLKVNRAVSVSDSSGKIEAKQIELPIRGRLEFLKQLRRDIYHFGMGVDTSGEQFGENRLGTAPSGMSLKYQYTQLDLKASGLMIRLKRMIKEILWFATADYNARKGTNYDAQKIYANLNLNRMMNDLETVEMIRDSSDLLSRRTLLSYHPFVGDVNKELRELEAEALKEKI